MANIRPPAKPGHGWQVQIRLKGVPPKTKTLPTEADAIAWAAEEEARILANRSAALEAGKLNNDKTLSGYVDDYLSSRQYEEKRQSTRRRERQCADVIKRFLGRYSLEQITPYLLHAEYIDKRSKEEYRGKKIAGDTIRCELALLSAVLDYLQARDVVKLNVVKTSRLDTPKLGKRKRVISEEEERKLLAYARHYTATGKKANSSFYPWLMFLFQTGSRPGEASKIKLAWLNIPESCIVVPDEEHKNDHARYIHLSTHLLPIIKEQVAKQKAKGSIYLFSSNNGERPFAYGQPWVDALKACGIEGAVPHSIRHTFITRLFEQTTLNETQIASLVGQVNVLSLRPYAHVRKKFIKTEAEQFAEIQKQMRQDAVKKWLTKPLVEGVDAVEGGT